MNLFKFRIGKKREVNWMTVKCDKCKSSGDNIAYDYPYIMFVDRDEIQIRPTGFKGRIQAYTTCTKCGKTVVIPEQSIPKNIWNYILQKAYESGENLEL